MPNNNPGLSLFTSISEHLPSNLLFKAAQPTCNPPKEAISTSQKEKQVEYIDICTPVLGNVHHKTETGKPEAASACFQSFGPQTVCQLMELSLSKPCKVSV